MSLAPRLEAGLAAMDLPLDASTQQRLLDYVALLAKWNKVYNLTAVRDPEEMLGRHILDSLAAVPYIRGDRLIDVGSGGGLPGIPLALALPKLQVTLLDSNHKKATFLQQACINLKLANAQAVCSRVEALPPEQKYDVVVSRAFSDLAEFVKLTRHLVAPAGILLAMKGLYPHEEIAGLPEFARVTRVTPLEVPGVDGQRHLVEIEVKQ